jgi:hypothetical protein
MDPEVSGFACFGFGTSDNQAFGDNPSVFVNWSVSGSDVEAFVFVRG